MKQETEMTMIIDHAPQGGAAGIGAVARFFRRSRATRRINREHAMLMAMSGHQLKDIGLTHGEVAFGITSGRGVFRDMDR